MNLVRDIVAKKFNLFRFTYGDIVLCNPAEADEIISVINNYQTTIYYSFYKEKISELKKFIELKNKLKNPVTISIN